jgi:hypothetical protein
VSELRRCQGITATGSRCERVVGSSQSLCYAHSPAHADQRRENASKAARSRHGGELAEVKAQLRTIASDVLEGNIETGRASVAGQVLGVYLRAVEAERRERELNEIEAELEELRGMLTTNGSNP